jgi:hypothetical protein
MKFDRFIEKSAVSAQEKDGKLALVENNREKEGLRI